MQAVLPHWEDMAKINVGETAKIKLLDQSRKYLRMSQIMLRYQKRPTTNNAYVKFESPNYSG